jgi:hypothetical protein
LDLRGLRHLQFHLINALDAFLHQATQELPVPEIGARNFIAPARLVPRSNATRPVARVSPCSAHLRIARN